MVPSINESAYAAARRSVESAETLLVITGAGMSAECGIPTFRGAGGQAAWDDAAQTLATPQGFRADPQRVWTWYLQRRREALSVQLHPGYVALANWERRAQVNIVTQNVDGLHRRAGSSRVVELHGTLYRFICADRGHDVTGVDDQDDVPHCPRCGSYVRPAVVWFGEAIPEVAIQGMAEAILEAQAVLVVGTSLLVGTPVPLLRSAERHGLPIVEVNPEPALPPAEDRHSSYNEWDLPSATVTLPGPAGVVLPRLLRLP